jgi:cytochrome P450
MLLSRNPISPPAPASRKTNSPAPQLDVARDRSMTIVQDRRDLAAFYLNLSRTGGEVVPYRVDGRPAFLVNRPEHARHVLVTNQRNYRNPAHPYADLAAHYRPPGVFMLRLNRQAEGRGTALARGADELVAVASETADELLEQSAAAPVGIDLAAKCMMFRVIARTLFGVDPRPLSEAFVRAIGLIEECWANHGFSDAGAGDDPLGRRYLQAIATQDGVAAWIARRAAMVPAGAPVPPEMVAAIVRTLLNSYNATATALCWLIHVITRDDRLLARLYEEVDRVVGLRRPAHADVQRLNYARMVVMELLRLYPPAWVIGREAIAPDCLGSTGIPAGAIISVSAYTMHRLPSVWDRPNDFIPERFAAQGAAGRPPFAYFPFGGGARHCPAGSQAIGQLQLALATLLSRCRIEAAGPERVRPRGLVALRPHPGVWARFAPRDRHPASPLLDDGPAPAAPAALSLRAPRGARS